MVWTTVNPPKVTGEVNAAGSTDKWKMLAWESACSWQAAKDLLGNTFSHCPLTPETTHLVSGISQLLLSQLLVSNCPVVTASFYVSQKSLSQVGPRKRTEPH